MRRKDQGEGRGGRNGRKREEVYLKLHNKNRTVSVEKMYNKMSDAKYEENKNMLRGKYNIDENWIRFMLLTYMKS